MQTPATRRDAQRSIPKKKRWIFSIVVILAALLAAEAAFRTAVYFKTPAALVFDPDLIYSFAADSTAYGVKLNASGFIGDDLARNPTDSEALRVVLLGGSTSFSELYVSTLRRTLEEALQKKCAVTSLGRPRYTSYQARVLAERTFATYSPDVAVVYLGINDTIYNTFWWVTDAPQIGYLNWRDPWPPVLMRGLEYHLYQKRLRATPDFPRGRLRSEAILRANIQRILEVANEEGVQLVLSEFAVGLPTSDSTLASRIAAQEPIMRHFWGNVDSTLRAVAAHNAVLAQIARDNNLVVAPVAQQIPHNHDYFNDICHLTAQGNRILAQTIASAIITSMERDLPPQSTTRRANPNELKPPSSHSASDSPSEN